MWLIGITKLEWSDEKSKKPLPETRGMENHFLN